MVTERCERSWECLEGVGADAAAMAGALYSLSRVNINGRHQHRNDIHALKNPLALRSAVV